jgi:hypothetical protein
MAANTGTWGLTALASTTSLLAGAGGRGGGGDAEGVDQGVAGKQD